MKTNELLKLLKKNGCSLIRHGSNHDIWYSLSLIHISEPTRP